MGRQKLHSAYSGKRLISDTEEVRLYRDMICWAKEDGLDDLSKTLQDMFDS